MSVEKISDRRSKVVGPHQRKRLAVRQLGKGAGVGRVTSPEEGDCSERIDNALSAHLSAC